MTAVTREAQLFERLASLADTLVAGYDVVELLQGLVDSCAELLDVSAAGLLLADADGHLELVASTSEENRLVEAMQVAAAAGPCIESFRTGSVVSLPDVRDAPPEWPDFQRACIENGFASVYAIPLRLRDTTIGTLNLFRPAPGPLNDRDAQAAQALADMATIGILHERTWREADTVRAQLQAALTSRIVIEQAKGVLAQTHRIPVDDAFLVLRRYARDHQLPLGEVAQRLVDRTLIF
ncbi:GAF and ANTAR domain-containing protein [Lysobacter korlensis]|uniref:GAF and ANTAR domain-containing protein n=1 Tax=Lysobacter korlensis TaxID=553636 RepID=A0ABV6RTI4_9GAMM